jgi:hypothetical protein
MGCIRLGIGENGIYRSMRKLEWHISNFGFYNDIFSSCGSYSGIDSINPTK